MALTFTTTRAFESCFEYRADDAAHGDFLRFIEEVASRHSAAIVEAFLRAP